MPRRARIDGAAADLLRHVRRGAERATRRDERPRVVGYVGADRDVALGRTREEPERSLALGRPGRRRQTRASDEPVAIVEQDVAQNGRGLPAGRRPCDTAWRRDPWWTHASSET